MLEALHSTKSVGLWASLAAKLNSFAKESGLVQRISKQFSPQAFLLSQLEAVSTGRASLNQLVASIGHEEEALVLFDFVAGAGRDIIPGIRHPGRTAPAPSNRRPTRTRAGAPTAIDALPDGKLGESRSGGTSVAGGFGAS